MAADLTLRGHLVALHTRNRSKIDAITANGGIDLTGVAGHGHAAVAYVGDDIARAVEGAALIAMPVPGMVQEQYLDLLLPHIAVGQVLWLCPGNAASLLVQDRLRALEKEDLLIVESVALPYGTRRTSDASVAVRALYVSRCAAFPAKRTPEALAVVGQLYRCDAAENVLEVALMNVNALIHPLPTLMNWGPIEARKGAFSLYGEGMTPGVLRCLQACDQERVAVCRELGLSTLQLDEIYERVLGTRAMYREAMGMGSAEKYEHRFVKEDVPVGLVMISSLARTVGLSTPMIDAVVTLASALYEEDFRASGRTADRLGIGQLGPAALAAYLNEGRSAHVPNAQGSMT